MARALPAQNKRKDMTEEQIKGLKPGDLLRETYEVQEVSEDYVILRYQSGANFGMCTKDSPMARQAELVQPAPTFEVGDTVRIIPDPLTGTIYGNGSLYGNWVLGEARILKETARATEMKLAKLGGPIVTINVHCLALVKKAVKNKYETRCHNDRISIVDNTTRTPDYVAIVATFSQAQHPNAEAAAEAECARLNADWKKQQEGKEGADHE